MGTLKLIDLIPIIRTYSPEQFARLYPDPFFLRRRAESELTSPLGYQTGFALPSVKLPTEDDNTETTLQPLDTRDSGTNTVFVAAEDLSVQYQLDSLTKSQANTFPGVTIGRAHNNDVVIPISTVSKFHAWVAKEVAPSKGWFNKEKKSGYLLYNANSRFGTFNNGVQVVNDVGSLLIPGAKVKLGDASLTFFDAVSLYQWILAKLPSLRQ